jgi:hypothetical protein
MSSELFREGGPMNVKKIGPDRYSMAVTLPTDAQGRAGRECPNADCSPAYFKVKPGTGITGGQTVAYCPYCRTAKEPSDFHTKEQVRYAKDLAVREATAGVNGMLRNALGLDSTGKRRLGSGGFLSITMEMKSSPPPQVRGPNEEILRRDIVCPHCTLDHSVYGFATWCSDCGKDIFMTHIAGEIQVLKSIIGDVERRRSELGVRVAARDLENVLEDLVSIFEATLKIEIRRFRKMKGDDEETIERRFKKIGSRLQSIPNAIQIVDEHCDGLPLFGAAPTGQPKLDQVFQKRHPITHNLGIVDRKYIERVRSGVLEGTEVLVEKQEVVDGAEIVYSVLVDLHRRLFPG